MGNRRHQCRLLYLFAIPRSESYGIHHRRLGVELEKYASWATLRLGGADGLS